MGRVSQSLKGYQEGISGTALGILKVHQPALVKQFYAIATVHLLAHLSFDAQRLGGSKVSSGATLGAAPLLSHLPGLNEVRRQL